MATTTAENAGTEHVLREPEIGPQRGRIESWLPAIAGFGLPFLLIAYLAIDAGGYDVVVRGQVGIILWFLVLVGVGLGLLPVARLTRSGWTMIGILGALALWTGLGALTWTESTERSMIEFARAVTLLGALVLLISIQGREGLRRTVAAVGAAVAVVAFVALASRFHPGWFPATEIPGNFPVSRLNYPLEYWNGLAAFLAIGAAPLIWLATSARTIAARAAAAGALPVVLLACYLTASRGGAIEAAAAILVLVVLFPRRLGLVPTFVVIGAGTLALMAFIAARPELRDHDPGQLALDQGNEMIWLTLLVFALTAAAHWGVSTLIERGRIVIPEVSRKTARTFGIVVAAVAAVVVIVAFASGFVGEKWSSFKQPAVGDSTVSRLGNLSSGERYLVWDSAVDASRTESLTGIGPGTFEYFWARAGNGTQFVRDAHSLYLEGLAEMGPVGFLLVLALVIFPIGLAGTGAVRRGPDDRRALLATAAAGMVAFAIAAGIDWAWELTVLPVAFLALVAAAVGPAGSPRRGQGFGWAPRVSIGVACVVAIAAISIPTLGTMLVRESQEKYRQGDVEGALDEVDSALGVQPYSASAHMQKALLLSQDGDPEGAIEAARDATEDEPTNWRTWYVLEQVATAAEDVELATTAEAKVEELNKRSTP